MATDCHGSTPPFLDSGYYYSVPLESVLGIDPQSLKKLGKPPGPGVLAGAAQLSGAGDLGSLVGVVADLARRHAG